MPLFRGILFFPVTPFDIAGRVAAHLLEEHIAGALQHAPAAVFAAGGAGELHALSLDEHAAVTQCAVLTVRGRCPVFVGAGGPLPVAQAMCATAAAAGADGILLLPPYLVASPQRGMVEYVAQVAAASRLPVIVYSRANARLGLEAAVAIAGLDNVAGIKDGVGDVELMQRIMTAVQEVIRRPFLFMNGLPTAELSARAYRGMGVRIYSSAVFAFAPEIATAFWRALDAGADDALHTLLAEFYLPFAALRDEAPGFAVSLVKAAVTARGIAVGGVRAPLTDPSEQQRERLEALIDHGLEVARSIESALP
jgi:5-dehydro-4-deoxyglucarate dehydratase